MINLLKNNDKWKKYYYIEMGYPNLDTLEEREILDRRLKMKMFLDMQHEKIIKNFIEQKFIIADNFNFVMYLINDLNINDITDQDIEYIVNAVIDIRYT